MDTENEKAEQNYVICTQCEYIDQSMIDIYIYIRRRENVLPHQVFLIFYLFGNLWLAVFCYPMSKQKTKQVFL